MTQPPNRQSSSGNESDLVGRVTVAMDERGVSGRVRIRWLRGAMAHVQGEAEAGLTGAWS